MARFFIDRPVFAWVVSIVIMLAGVLSITQLPIAQYPEVAPPSVSISASYPGASAKTLEDSVVQIIEQNITGIDNVEYMSSTSESSGRAEVSVSHAGGGFLGAATARDTLWGWTLGGGIEYLSGPWMFRLEYLHYDLGDIDLAYAVAPAATVATSTNFSGDIVRAGISYKFNWTPLGILLGRDRF